MSPKKTIAQVGYFGFGNYGDELFLKVYEQFFPEFNLTPINKSIKAPYFNHVSCWRLLRSNAVVIGGGDLVVPWQMSTLYWRREYLIKPVFITGIGVPTWQKADPEVINKLSAFFQHANVKFISCRDAQSAEWIREYLKPSIPVQHSADLVCALDYKPGQAHTGDKVLGLITRPSIFDFNNSPLKDLYNKAIDNGYQIRHIILATGSTQHDDLEHFGKLDFSHDPIICHSIDELTHQLGQCSMVYSMKFHGCVAAYMMGIPVVALSKADKFTSFMKSIGHPDFCCTVLEPHLPTLIDKQPYEISAREISLLRDSAVESLHALKTSLNSHV